MRLFKKILIILIVFVATQVQATSFRCQSVHSLVEHAICNSPELSAMDDLMAESYKNALAAAQDAGVIQEEQHRWVIERNKCNDIGCLIKTYQGRIWQLLPIQERGEQWVAGVYEAGDNRLDIIQFQPHKIRFRLFAISSTGNMGEIEGKGQIYDGIAKFVDQKVSCSLTLHIKGKGIVLSQAGYCGFGLNVVADGEYHLVEGKSPVVRDDSVINGD